MPESNKPTLYTLRAFTAASTAAITANLVTHPLETIKVRQVLHSGSTWGIARGMVVEEGFASLYKGIGAAVIRAAISGGGRLTCYEMLKDSATDNGVLGAKNNVTASAPISALAAVPDALLLGAFASGSGCFCQLVAAPFDVIRTRQAANKLSTPSLGQVFRDIYRTNGVSGLFAGSSALMGRAITFNIAQLCTYDQSKAAAAEWIISKRRGDLGLGEPAVCPLAARTAGQGQAAVPLTKWEALGSHVLASLSAGLVATTASCPAENLKTVTVPAPSPTTTQPPPSPLRL
jgi:hypothetical protein